LLRIACSSGGISATGTALAMIAVSKLFPLRASADDAAHAFAGFELLATAVLVLDAARRVTYANPAAENLFELAKKHLVGHRPDQMFSDAAGLTAAIDKAVHVGATYTEQELELTVAGKAKLHLTCTVSPVDTREASLLLEFRHIDQQLKIAREERLNEQQQANRELIRNLAHEIRNPLGGIRGAAQLLERELDRPQLIEYTQVVIGEADRLQSWGAPAAHPRSVHRHARHHWRAACHSNEIDWPDRVAQSASSFPATIRSFVVALPLAATDRKLH